MTKFCKQAAAKALARKFAQNARNKQAAVDPLLTGLGGAALGGLGGIVGEHFGGREDDEKDYISRALTGAAVGGALGGGGAAAYNAFGTWADPNVNKLEQLKADHPTLGTSKDKYQHTKNVAEGKALPNGVPESPWMYRLRTGLSQEAAGLAGDAPAWAPLPTVAGMAGGQGLAGAALAQMSANTLSGKGPLGRRYSDYSTLGDKLKALFPKMLARPADESGTSAAFRAYLNKLQGANPDLRKRLQFDDVQRTGIGSGIRNAWREFNNRARTEQLAREAHQIQLAANTPMPTETENKSWFGKRLAPTQKVHESLTNDIFGGDKGDFGQKAPSPSNGQSGGGGGKGKGKGKGQPPTDPKTLALLIAKDFGFASGDPAVVGRELRKQEATVPAGSPEAEKIRKARALLVAVTRQARTEKLHAAKAPERAMGNLAGGLANTASGAQGALRADPALNRATQGLMGGASSRRTLLGYGPTPAALIGAAMASAAANHGGRQEWRPANVERGRSAAKQLIEGSNAEVAAREQEIAEAAAKAGTP